MPTRPAGALAAVLAAVLVVLAVPPLLLAAPTHSRVFAPAGAVQKLQQQPQETLAQGQAYLTKYGWLSRTGTQLGSLQSLSSTLAEFQQFAGLPVTGVLDDATVAKMQQPRCGVRDKLAPSRQQRGRRKRYVMQGSRWRRRELKYKIVSWPSERDQAITRRTLQEAFQAWSEVSSMTFIEVDAIPGVKADMDIGFEYSDHGDGETFDGPGGTLAHAFFPIYGGDIHFDKSEPWKVDPTSAEEGFDLYSVATHEFGHSLGLAHSEVNNSLMAPFYQPPSPDRDIMKRDDINGIQELYGKNLHTLTHGGGSETDDDREARELVLDPDLCADSSVDAMVTMVIGGRTRTYVFRGGRYWRLTHGGVVKGYPQKIADKWGGVPDNIDAVLAYAPRPGDKQMLFFFKGKDVWRMSEVPRVDTGYPKLISSEFKGIPNHIDAAFTWEKNNKIYFFKGTRYWRFDYQFAQSGIQAVSDLYPKEIATWKGVPNNIDAVNTWRDGRTYFFKGNQYYKISDATVQVYDGYPRNTGDFWFGCSPPETSTEASTEATTTSTDASTSRGALSNQWSGIWDNWGRDGASKH